MRRVVVGLQRRDERIDGGFRGGEGLLRGRGGGQRQRQRKHQRQPAQRNGLDAE